MPVMNVSVGADDHVERDDANPTPVRVLYVAVPRAVFDRYWPLSWAEILAAAERGDDGLVPETAAPKPWLGQAGEKAPDRPDVAFLREGRERGGRLAGRALLYQQNW